MCLKKLREGCFLNADRFRDACNDLDAALISVLKQQQHLRWWPIKYATASPALWAIVLAQKQYAQLSTGWVVDSEAAAEQWTMGYMHDYLYTYKGERNERELRSATCVGKGVGKGKRRGAVADPSKASRSLRVDSLGSDEEQRKKVFFLHKLLSYADRPLPDCVRTLAKPLVHGFSLKGSARTVCDKRARPASSHDDEEE